MMARFFMEIFMRLAIQMVLLLASAFSSNPVYADDIEQLNGLLLKNNCLACHTIDKRKYGPILREVSAKYAGDSKVIERLASKIRSGGTGVWGEDIMPPQPQVSAEEAKQIVQLILQLPPK